MADTTDKHIPTIVYVEDNSGDAVLLEEALRERGHAVELMVIDSGDKALRYFKVKSTARDLPPPHCVLLDSHLPVIAGAQLLKFIRGSDIFDRTPVYLFGAGKEYREVSETTPVDPQSFLDKPDHWLQFLALADLLMTSARSGGHAVRRPDADPGRG